MNVVYNVDCMEGMAAYKVGLDFVGFEIDPENFAAEEQRFAEYTAQRSLFYG